MALKRFTGLVLALALLCGFSLAAVGAANPADPGLRFKRDGTFKIIQVADTQDFFLSGTITQDFIYDLAAREKPDLFVLTGDNVSTGGASDSPAFFAGLQVRSSVEALMCAFDRVYRDFGTRVTMVYGNHDNEAGPDKVTKAEQFAIYKRHKNFVGHYLAEADGGTSDGQGQHYGTHNLLIRGSAGEAPVFGLWMFDSGSYDPRGGYSCVQEPQIDWFKATNAATGKLPSLAFQHIAVPEVYDVLPQVAAGTHGAYSRSFINADGSTYTKYVMFDPSIGFKESAGCSKYNEGQSAALDEAGNVMAIFWGHDHNNSYQLKRTGGTDFVSSPSTGFGAYGEAENRGARVIILDENDLSDYETYVVTYRDFYGDTPLREARLEMFSDNGVWESNIMDAL
jgi:predicted phosphodiesterase